MGVERIGYTLDGLIFMIIEGKYEQTPIKSIIQMSILEAKELKLGLTLAINGAEENIRIIENERNCANLN